MHSMTALNTSILCQSNRDRVESIGDGPINISWSEGSGFLESDMDNDISFDGPSLRSNSSLSSMEEWQLNQDEFPSIGDTRKVAQPQGIRDNEMKNQQEKEKLLSSLGLSDQTAVEEFNSVVEETFREACASWSDLNATCNQTLIPCDRLEYVTGTWDNYFPPGFELQYIGLRTSAKVGSDLLPPLRDDIDELHVSNFPGSTFFQNRSDACNEIPVNNENVNSSNSILLPPQVEFKNSNYGSVWTDTWKPVCSNHDSSWDIIESSWRKDTPIKPTVAVKREGRKLPKLGLSTEPGFLPRSKMDFLMQEAIDEVKLKYNGGYGLVPIMDRFTKPARFEDSRTISVSNSLYLL